jgi:selT/selW/selH-like putative selenoprotein
MRFVNLRRKILESMPNAVVEGDEGRRRSFEVYVNGKIQFSKLRTDTFPDVDVVSILADHS